VCPACRGALEVQGEVAICPRCRASYRFEGSVPVLLSAADAPDDVERVRALYDEVAHEYDHVFSRHVTMHYLDKRRDVVRGLAPPRGLVLDVGCGTGALAGHVARADYDVVGLDISPGMLTEAAAQGIAGVFAGSSERMPFADGTFDLAYTVATLHHLETPERVAGTIAEMGRVVRPGGRVLLWDHNPLNPYWVLLMKRVPQDSGDERLVPLREILADVRAAGLRPVSARRLGFIPDFVPAALMPLARATERLVERTPGLRLLAVHNVVVGEKVSPSP
jgi:SAM-dependent methyltransferase